MPITAPTATEAAMASPVAMTPKPVVWRPRAWLLVACIAACLLSDAGSDHRITWERRWMTRWPRAAAAPSGGRCILRGRAALFRRLVAAERLIRRADVRARLRPRGRADRAAS